MKASILDLRYKMKDVLKALDRNEEVDILYHGKLKGVIMPRVSCGESKIADHPFFNMRKGEGTVSQEMERLRGGCYCDL